VYGCAFDAAVARDMLTPEARPSNMGPAGNAAVLQDSLSQERAYAVGQMLQSVDMSHVYVARKLEFK
jgi:hypothetical protein